MGAISFLTGFLADTEVRVTADGQRCLRNRLGGNRCNHCLIACPHGALSYENSRLQLRREKCGGCGRCHAVCPNDVFSSSCDLHDILERLESRENITFSCFRQQSYRDPEIVIACLGAFSYEALSYLGSLEGLQRVRFICSGCRSCDNSAAGQAFEDILESFNEKWGKTLEVDFTLVKETEKSRADRRSFLTTLTKGAVDKAGKSVAKKTAAASPPAAERRAPAKIRLLQRIGVQESQMRKSAPFLHHLQPRLAINGSCVPCPRCSGICPTGALTREKEAKKQLLFDAQKCSSCGLCLDFCRQGSLALFSPLA